MEMPRLRLGVLISGRGSNLQALIDACATPAYPAEIVCVVSNIAGVEGLDRAKRAGIPAHVIPPSSYSSRERFDETVDAILCAHGVSFVCLAGFMRLLSESFVQKGRGR